MKCLDKTHQPAISYYIYKNTSIRNPIIHLQNMSLQITYYIYKTCHYKSQNKLHLQNTSFINHITFTKHFILKSYNSFTKQVIYKSHITFTKKHHLKIPYNMWLKNVFLINHDVYLSLNVVTLESKVISATWSCKDVPLGSENHSIGI